MFLFPRNMQKKGKPTNVKEDHRPDPRSRAGTGHRLHRQVAGNAGAAALLVGRVVDLHTVGVDVYKRQECGRPRPAAKCANCGFVPADPANPVSYTHLDVYKRQVGDIDDLVAAVFQIAAQGIEHDQRAGIADVDIVCLLYTSRCV